MTKPNQRYYGKQPNNPISKAKCLSAQRIQTTATNSKNEQTADISQPKEGATNKWWQNWNKADIISAGMLLATAILMLFTGGLYYSAIMGENTSSKAVTIANKTFIETHTYDSISLVKQDSAFAASNRYNDASIDVQHASNVNSDKNSKNAIEAQIKAINESRTQFEKVNEPYLQSSLAVIESFNKGQDVKITIAINNLKETPVKIVEKKSKMNRSVLAVQFDTIKFTNDTEDLNQYVIKNAPAEIAYYFPTILFDKNRQDYINGIKFIFLAIQFKYQNLITKRYRYYKALLRINPLAGNRTYTRFIYNENVNALD